MSTGPEHYRKAERLLAEITTDDGFVRASDIATYIAAAQVHATLAMAAATGTYGIVDDTRSPEDATAWEHVAGEYTAQRDAAAKRRAAYVCPCGCQRGQSCNCGLECECVGDCPICDAIARANEAEALAAQENAAHDPAACTECNEPDDEDAVALLDRTGYIRAQLDGEACTQCGGDFAVGESAVPTGVVIDGGQLFAHADCVETEAASEAAQERFADTENGGEF